MTGRCVATAWLAIAMTLVFDSPAIQARQVTRTGQQNPKPEPGAVKDPVPPAMADRGARLEVSAFEFRRAVPEAGEGLVALQLDAAVLAHSRGPRDAFADVRIVDAEGYQIPYLLERRDDPLTVDLPLRGATDDERAGLAELAGSNHSVYRVTLPYQALPGARLVLETSERVFRRRVQVGVRRNPDREHRAAWFEAVASSDWRHADQDSAPEPLDLGLGGNEATELLLVVEEGDNRALPLTAARVRLPSWHIRFFKPSGPVWLVYGNDAVAAPQYDLGLLSSTVMRAEARQVTAAPESARRPDQPRQLSPVVFWTAFAAAVLVLLGLLVRLVISGTQRPGF